MLQRRVILLHFASTGSRLASLGYLWGPEPRLPQPRDGQERSLPWSSRAFPTCARCWKATFAVEPSGPSEQKKVGEQAPGLALPVRAHAWVGEVCLALFRAG